MSELPDELLGLEDDQRVDVGARMVTMAVLIREAELRSDGGDKKILMAAVRMIHPNPEKRA